MCSQAVSSAANRTKFVNAIVSAINTYKLAGASSSCGLAFAL